MTYQKIRSSPLPLSFVWLVWPLAAAIPPLTPQIQNDFAAAVAEALDLPADPPLAKLLREWRQSAWDNRDQGEIDGTLYIVNAYRRHATLSPAQATGARALLRISLIATLRRNAPADPVAAELVRLYERRHPALADGDPPLILEAADAWVDLIALAKTGGFSLSPSVRQAEKRALIEAYPNAGADRQLLVFQSIYFATRLKAEWPQLSAAARQDWTARIRGIFAPPTMDSTLQHMLNQHSFRMMQNQLEFMKQNTDTILGSPPYFDPSCNCWKQRGGVVTEYR